MQGAGAATCNLSYAIKHGGKLSSCKPIKGRYRDGGNLGNRQASPLTHPSMEPRRLVNWLWHGYGMAMAWTPSQNRHTWRAAMGPANSATKRNYRWQSQTHHNYISAVHKLLIGLPRSATYIMNLYCSCTRICSIEYACPSNDCSGVQHSHAFTKPVAFVLSF